MKLAKSINESLDTIADSMIGKANSASHRKIVQSIFRKYNAKVLVAVDDNVSEDMIVVTGQYLPWRIRQNIEIFLTYPVQSKRVQITQKMWKTLKFELSQVLQHELIHRQQCSHIQVPKEDWEDHACKVYASKASVPAKKMAQEYFGSTEEIEAHAHCIMMELEHYAPRTDPYKFLRFPKKVQTRHSPTLKDYLETFDYDMKHPAIRRLFKKIVYWIEYEA